MAASSQDQVNLARKLYAQLGDRAATVDALTGMGFTKKQATAALAAAAPTPSTTADPAGSAAAHDGPKPRGRAGSPKEAGAPAPPVKGGGAALGRKSSGPAAPSGGFSSWSPPKILQGGMPRPSLRLPRKVTAADAGSFALGMVGFALFLNYIEYGGAGVRGWFAAKFLNRPYQPPAAPPRKSTDGGPSSDGNTTRPGRSDFTGQPYQVHPNTGPPPAPKPKRHQPDPTPGGITWM